LPLPTLTFPSACEGAGGYIHSVQHDLQGVVRVPQAVTTASRTTPPCPLALHIPLPYDPTLTLSPQLAFPFPAAHLSSPSAPTNRHSRPPTALTRAHATSTNRSPTGRTHSQTGSRTQVIIESSHIFIRVCKQISWAEKPSHSTDFRPSWTRMRPVLLTNAPSAVPKCGLLCVRRAAL